MFNSIQKMREVKKQSKIKDNISYDSENRAIVPISVENDDGFLSPYSIKGEEIISQDVANFLEDNIAGNPLKNGLHLQIQGKTIDDMEEKRYENGIRNYYRKKVLDANRDLKRNAIASLIMFLIGCLILTLYLVIEFSNSHHILAGIIDIAAWVFVWEAVDLFLIQRKLLKLKAIRYYELFNSKISFVG